MATNNDLCQVCQQDVDDEELVLCDGCDFAFHTYCFIGCTCGDKKCRKKPNNFNRKTAIPEGDWFCKFCRGRAPQSAEHEDWSANGDAVFAFGHNEAGQLGIGKLDKAKVGRPTIVQDLKGVEVAQIACGGWNSVILDRSGNVYTCGDGTMGKTGHVDVIHEYLSRFRLVEALQPENVSQGEGRPVRVWQGRDFTNVVTAAGHLYSWGAGEKGQHGHQDLTNKKQPKKISAFRENEIDMTRVGGVGWDFGVMLSKEEGEMWAWGNNSNGQLTFDDLKNKWVPKCINPQQAHKHNMYAQSSKVRAFPIGTNVAQIAAGKSHVAVRTTDNKIWTWGSSGLGALGFPKPPPRPEEANFIRPPPMRKLIPEPIAELAEFQVTQVVCGGDHCMVLTADQRVFVWGSAQSGQLGLGNSETQFTPVELTDLADKKIISLAAGDNHSLALSADGSVYSWGKNVHGQLGHGSFFPKKKPARIAALSNIGRIVAGGDHSFAIARPAAGTKRAADKISK